MFVSNHSATSPFFIFLFLCCGIGLKWKIWIYILKDLHSFGFRFMFTVIMDIRNGRWS